MRLWIQPFLWCWHSRFPHTGCLSPAGQILWPASALRAWRRKWISNKLLSIFSKKVSLTYKKEWKKLIYKTKAFRKIYIAGRTLDKSDTEHTYINWKITENWLFTEKLIPPACQTKVSEDTEPVSYLLYLPLWAPRAPPARVLKWGVSPRVPGAESPSLGEVVLRPLIAPSRLLSPRLGDLRARHASATADTGIHMWNIGKSTCEVEQLFTTDDGCSEAYLWLDHHLHQSQCARLAPSLCWRHNPLLGTERWEPHHTHRLAWWVRWYLTSTQSLNIYFL